MANFTKLRALRPRRFLDVLPEEIYDKSDESHLVRLMAALCGDSGVGGLRKRLALKRMQTTLAETHYTDLDGLYSRMFGLPRLPSERYPYIPSDLLTWDQLREMDVKDARYRRRILTYMKSFMHGATVRGLEMCAEGGCGVPCQVIDLTRYYGSLGIGEGKPDYDPIGGQGENTGHQWLVVPMQDGEPTPEQTYGMANALYSLQPADAVFYVATRERAAEVLGADIVRDQVAEVAGVEASSSWWRVKRYVTGRLDWDYERYPSEWIEPNVRKEAPRQALVNCQEESDDFSYTARSVTASSSHVGPYGFEHAKAFPSLAEVGRDGESKPENAISRTFAKWYTGSYYDGGAVACWSYPVEMAGLLTDEAAEKGRAPRYWSSEERGGDEWLEVELKRTVPLNRLSLNICRKPVRVSLLFSSWDEGGERVWVPAVDSLGRRITYTNRAFGGSSVAGEYVKAEFSFPVVYADAVRLEFERLDVPYLKSLGSQTFEEVEFPWSVEVSGLEFGLDVFRRDDFRPATFPDMFGNTVETELEDIGPERAVDGNDWTMWLSQPNVTQDAVEWLVLDLRRDGAGQRINYVDVDGVYAGFQMNAYSSEDGETWSPYPESFEVYGGRYRLPTRIVSFLKLEFTRLCAVPYEIIKEGVPVETRTFPYKVTSHIDEVGRYTREMTRAQRLLTTPEESGAAYFGKAVDTTSALTDPINTAGLMSGAAYRTNQQSAVAAAYGRDMAVERPLSQSTPDVEPGRSKRSSYKFYEEGPHEYDVRRDYRKLSVAYVVGVGKVECGLEAGRLLLDNLDPCELDLLVDTTVERNDGWVVTNSSRLRPASDDYVCSLWTADVTSACNFRSFDVTIDQSMPHQLLEHPSHMAEEWSPVGGASAGSSEFGTNGTVLRVECGPGGGVETENRLVHAVSMAQASVDIFDDVGGTWLLEAVDAYGEQMFAQRYELPARKWVNVGATFNPQPGGGWWNRDYAYRVRIPVVGPVAEGQGIFVPFLDTTAMRGAGLIQQPVSPSEDGRAEYNRYLYRAVHRDLRFVFFDGTSCEEVPFHQTAADRFWIRARQDVPSGVVADGAYHRDVDGFVGAYYVYFGNPDETTLPLYDWVGEGLWDSCRVSISGASRFYYNAYRQGRGTWGNWSENGFYSLGNGPGFVRFFMGMATEGLSKNPDGSESPTPSKRVVFRLSDYEAGLTAEAYYYERQFVFKFTDPDGYESAFVSHDDAVPLKEDGSVRVFIRWGERGSEPVYKDGVLNPGDNRRRRIEVFCDSDEPLECIDNVYDQTVYFEGVY